MGTVTTRDGQGLYDIAVQEYGSRDGAYWLVKDNAGLNMNTRLEAGQVLVLRDAVINAAIRDHFKKNNTYPQNGIRPGEDIVSGFSDGFDGGFGGSGGAFDTGFGDGFLID